MPLKQKAYFNWSSGKDASLALYYLKKEHTVQVDRLLTCINTYYNRVSMHGVRRELVEQQAHSIGLPLTTVELPEEPTMETYNRLMNASIAQLQSEGYTSCGFGDIYLEDLRAYREKQLNSYNIHSYFPLWKKNTKTIISDFITLGFKAIVVSIKSEVLDPSFVGREIDEQFVKDLPPEVDPCGENGEFHTFCYDGPIYTYPIRFEVGENVYKEYNHPKQERTSQSTTMGFWFCDLLPKKRICNKT